jgi:hypothetical protein
VSTASMICARRFSWSTIFGIPPSSRILEPRRRG